MATPERKAATHPLLADIGHRVRALRQSRALTLKALAEASHLSERFVSELEAGRANISVMNLAEVAHALGVPLVSLLDDRAPEGVRRTVVALLGLRGAGKTTVGKALAERLGVGFLELDRLVETEAGMGLSEIFAIHGEEYYRRMELAALRRFLDSGKKAVLATGGGLVTSPEAYPLLRERAHTVWLRASPEEHWHRVVGQGDLRPMQNRPHAMQELKRRLREREPLYGKAELVCVTSGKSVAQVVAELTRRFS